MATDRSQIVLVPWYSREEFQLLRELSGQDSRLPADYDSWERAAVAATEQLLAQGRTVQPLTIRIQDYLSWLRQTGRKNSAGVRLRYLRVRAAEFGDELAVMRLSMSPAAGNGVDDGHRAKPPRGRS